VMSFFPIYRVTSGQWIQRKLSNFQKILSSKAKKYAEELVEKEMPTALKKYFEGEILPRMGLKINKGKWFNHMNRWMEAYWGNLDAKQAVFEVRKYSSRQYKSHRRPSENFVRQVDT
jgi:hypothetical protein